MDAICSERWSFNLGQLEAAVRDHAHAQQALSGQPGERKGRKHVLPVGGRTITRSRSTKFAFICLGLQPKFLGKHSQEEALAFPPMQLHGFLP